MNQHLLCNQAVGFHLKGDLPEAERLYLRILAAEPTNFTACHLLGVIRAQQERDAEALQLIGAALKINPDAPAALSNYGNVLTALGRPEEALASHDKALAIKPDFAQALNDRGIALWNMKRPEEALASYDKALAIDPDFIEALKNRGNALSSLNRVEEGLASYDKALAIKPDFAEALKNRARVLCENNRIEEGLATYYARAAELVCGPSADARQGNEADPLHKVRHDIEQRDYLVGGKAAGNARDAATLFHLADGSRLATPAINPDNARDIAEQWKTNRPQIVVIDNLLTPEALDGLRRFCWGSTIWRKIFKDGYLGTTPEYGFACPLLAQIADELRTTFSTIFRAHPLSYLWAFKYDSQLTGTDIHADSAAVNVNFWVTPDDANLDPESGGLVVWDVGAPLDWDFKRYNDDAAAARDFLARNGAKKTTVPYRANRAVVFDSNLFHKTDEMKFKDGYLNRRINITLLYGKRDSKGE